MILPQSGRQQAIDITSEHEVIDELLTAFANADHFRVATKMISSIKCSYEAMARDGGKNNALANTVQEHFPDPDESKAGIQTNPLLPAGTKKPTSLSAFLWVTAS
ncbi:hypothetical protein [Pseudomonas mandelii]|uniref:hypothetical protein n=1 Tax=Pseudomonas mandelii TaxID=75612 RepID=UPI0020A1FDB4|nr:hypothetical protein [Pseudomonas mandelii]MCO8310347.1 hypothetical protein [Pseudomonas mandelii]